MKVFVAIVLLIGSAAAGSGPYLPSGWKPGGPAFYLPSEVQKPVQPTDVTLQESEGASSDFLREYGPPKVQEVQNSPEEKPAFVVLRSNFGQDDAVEVTAEEVQSKVVDEQTKVDAVVPATTEVQDVPLINLEEKVDEAIAEVGEEVSSVSATVEAEVEEEVKAVKEGVNNIAEAIVKLEEEEVLISQDVAELRSGQQSTGNSALPEGFLEYGPPGFREYGPPKQNALLRSAEIKSEQEKIDNNETRRRRRFSPKFRSVRKQRKPIH